jgi:hypothetical protein
MNERNLILGAFYIVLFLLLAPLFFGGIAAIICWAPSGVWLSFWAVYTIGLIATAFIITPLVHKMYIINGAYTVSFHLDPFFGSNSTLVSRPFNENKQLVARGPGFHPVGWWEQFDSTTEHELEFRLDLNGKFETSGDNLNLEVKDGLMILKAPIESARHLRSIANGMVKIREEVGKQLTPSLKQATALHFIKYDSNYIMRNQAIIATDIRNDFEMFNQIKERYGLITQKFVLGDINFSAKINEAREAAKSASLRTNAVKEAKAEMTGLNDKEASEFVLASEKLATININRNVHEIIGLDPEVVKAAGEFAIAVKTLKSK